MAVTITLLQLVLKRVTALAPKSLLPSWGATALSPRPRPEQSKPNQSCFSVMFKRVLLLMIVAMVMMGMIMMMIVTLLVSMMTDDVLLITSSISTAIIITCGQAPLTANPKSECFQPGSHCSHRPNELRHSRCRGSGFRFIVLGSRVSGVVCATSLASDVL